MPLEAGNTLEFGDPHRPALGADRLLRQHAMAEGLRNRFGAHELVGTERTGDRRFEDVEFARIRRMSEQRRRHAEILAQDVRRNVLEPVAQQERAVLVEVAIVEDEQEFASIWTEALDRMGNAAGEIPEIADADFVNEVTALSIDRSDTGRPIQHVGPFRLFMPMKLTDSAGIEPHVHARRSLSKRQAPARSPVASNRRSIAAHARPRRKISRLGRVPELVAGGLRRSGF